MHMSIVSVSKAPPCCGDAKGYQSVYGLTTYLHARRRQRWRLRYLNDFLYLGEMLFKVFFHPHLEGHRGHGAGTARAFQPHFYRPVFFNAYELDISTISLERRTYLFQGFFNFFFVHGIFSFLMTMCNSRSRNSLYTILILFYRNFYDR